jgi:hypothetical protein
VCKATGATLAPPSFQSHLAFHQPTDVVGRIWLFQTDPRKFGPCVLKLVLLLFFPEATPQRSPNLTRS